MSRYTYYEYSFKCVIKNIQVRPQNGKKMFNDEFNQRLVCSEYSQISAVRFKEIS